MPSIDWNAKVKEALERTDIMALSTVDEDGNSWTAPVQYSYDSKLKLSFLSGAAYEPQELAKTEEQADRD